MWRDKAEEQRHPFEGDVCDIEDCKEPVVLPCGEGEVRFQTCDSSIADIYADI